MATDIPSNKSVGNAKTSNDNSSKESRTAIQKKSQIIKEFLQACSPYESDSLRAVLAFVSCDNPNQSIPPFDRAALNRYLNYGWNKENGDADVVRAHRQNRALELVKAVSQFVSKEEIITVTSVLLTISSDCKEIENMLNNLPKLQQSASPSGKVSHVSS